MKNDGGPAFPSGIAIGPSGDIYTSGYHSCGGMSVRVHVAAQAFHQMLRWEAAEGLSYEEIAEQAYMAADAFIAELEKTDD